MCAHAFSASIAWANADARQRMMKVYRSPPSVFLTGDGIKRSAATGVRRVHAAPESTSGASSNFLMKPSDSLASQCAAVARAVMLAANGSTTNCLLTA
jgi:hypothetical protein